MPPELAVQEFLRSGKALQLRNGGGEWDVLVYAVDNPEAQSQVVQPYGKDNPYRRLRTNRGCRVKLIATSSYMRWTYLSFEASEIAGAASHRAEGKQ